ncbi:MAG TPA: hypothetical protein ENK35_08625 [Candidatus Tenderia sp.]|nr:hypothetical protein [Candidatus Tenderia sp.]
MWQPSNRHRILALAFVLAAAPLSAQELAAPARPAAALPDLRAPALELDARCRVRFTLVNDGPGRLPATAYRRVSLWLSVGKDRRPLSLAAVDPQQALRAPGGWVAYDSELTLTGEERVTLAIDAEGRLREADEENNRRTATLRCAAENSRTGGPAPAAWSEPADEAPSVLLPFAGGSVLDAPLPPSPEELSPLPVANDPTVEPGEVMVLSEDMAAARALAAQARDSGIRILRRKQLSALGWVVSVFRVPAESSVAETIEQLRQQLPPERHGQVEANHRYRLQGEAGDPRRYGPRLLGWQSTPACGKGLRLGLVDTAIDRDHPDLSGADIRPRRFVTTGVATAPPDHGTAIAAQLLADPAADGVAGLLPGARLYAAEAFRWRDGAAETTSEWLIAALDWLAGEQVTVVNLSFAGPRNLLVEQVIERLTRRGVRVAAAAGNEGPGAPPRYPAAQAVVVAVTAVDADGRPWRRAAAGPHIDFAAPGVDLWSARPGEAHAYLSGTSYAVPFVSAALALESEASLRQQAQDLGETGRDNRFGWGVIQMTGCSGSE